LLKSEQQTLNLGNLARICETVKILHTLGHHVIVVTSGAVGVGCQRLGLTSKPTQVAKKQALAAVGQVHLMKYYEDFMSALGLTCAQVLLTLDNVANRGQYINACNTFSELLSYGVIPVVNENDTVAVQTLRFGDNDSLSAQVAALVRADWLFLMTDVDSLYTSNPKMDPDAQPIYEVPDMTTLQADTSTLGTEWGTGGMATKLTAARIATAAGCTMVICSSSVPENIIRIMQGEPNIGTKFFPVRNALRGRKRWILSVPVRGSMVLDDDMVAAVRDKHKSLYAYGIAKVTGDFQTQDCVSLYTTGGVEFARALVNYTTEEVLSIRGRRTQEVRQILQAQGYASVDEVANRDNVALLASSTVEEGDSPSEGEAVAATLNGLGGVLGGRM